MRWIELTERTIEWIGKVSAWVLLVLLAAIVGQVTLNALSRNISWMEEVQWYLYGSSSMLALAYTTTRGGHIRVDLFHRNLPMRVKQCLESLWVLVALIPLYVVMAVYGWEFTAESFAVGEGSPDPGGLPARWLVKAFIPLSAALLMVAAVARAILVWAKPELLEDTEVRYGD